MKIRFLKLLSLLVFMHMTVRAEIITPYPTVFELNQINSAEKERVRLCHTQKKYDKQPTGFYVQAGKTIVVNVEILTPADKGLMPEITVGTLGFNVDSRSTGVSTVLHEGENTISNHSGGMIWLSYIQNSSSDPKGKARITFTQQSEHVRVPRFVYGVTTNLEFKEMMTEYTTPDVLYQSDYVVVAATRDAALRYSLENNKVVWLNAIHTLIQKEDEISGMDSADPNPLHHPLNYGDIRFLLVQNTYSSPHASSAGYTGYPSGSINRYLTQIGVVGNNSWMLGHEIGHQHQQPTYLINKATESTVNIYSYVVERNIQGPGYIRTSAIRWQQVKDTYLKLPVSKRIYDMDDTELKNLTGYNHDETRFMVWEQMFLLFGDQFYKTLHRIVREERLTGGDPDERRSYLIWKASQITGYDLTDFYNLWGIRVDDSFLKADLRAKIAYAKTKGEIKDLSTLGLSAEQLIQVTGQSVPSWAPITMTGITSSSSAIPEVLDRSDWLIESSYAGISDASVGGDRPEYIIDATSSTAFAFVKPGKTFGGITVPADGVPSFTVDMRTTNAFNYVAYKHRLGNTSEYIRAREISVYGSLDGSQYTAIKEHHVIDYLANNDEIVIGFPEVKYRFVKIVIEDWNRSSGSTIQISNFDAGTEIPQITLPIPDPQKFKVNIIANEGINCSQAGIQLVNEGSDYTIHFTLNQNKIGATVTIDGDAEYPDFDNGVYSVLVNVDNHKEVILRSVADLSALNSISSESPIQIHPNPARAGQKFTISLNKDLIGTQLSLFSILGTNLYNGVCKQGTMSHTIDRKGIYIIKSKKNTQIDTLKFTVN